MIKSPITKASNVTLIMELTNEMMTSMNISVKTWTLISNRFKMYNRVKKLVRQPKEDRDTLTHETENAIAQCSNGQ